MLKSELIIDLQKKYPSLSSVDIELVLKIFFKKLIKSLNENKNVEIRGFGSFKVKHLKPRIGRNPKDGSRVEIPAKKKVHWKISKELFQKLNQDTDRNE